MLEKIKSKLEAIFVIGLFIVSGAFLYERSRRKSAEAIADNKEDLDKINELNKQISSNDGKLKSEEDKRNEIKKEAEDAKSNNSNDPSEFLKRR